MGKRELLLYAITLISLVLFIYLFFGVISKVPSTSNQKFLSLTGNAILDLNDNFKVGDKLTGQILLAKESPDAVGLLSLSKDGEEAVTETFNLKDIPTKQSGSNYVIDLADITDYTFNETGSYELLFSVLSLDTNIKKELEVK